MKDSGADPAFSGGKGGGGSSDKRPPTLSNCYCCLTSPFFTRKSAVLCFTLGVSAEPPEPSLDPP